MAAQLAHLLAHLLIHLLIHLLARSTARLRLQVTEIVSSLAKLHDTYIITTDTKRSVAVCGALWALSTVGRYLDLLQV